jgi:hypothetical protein
MELAACRMAVNRPPPGKTDDKEVVTMADTLKPAGSLSWARWGLFALSVLALGPAGCTSMSQDVDAYYRQMAYNYKEAQEKAQMDIVALENETKVLATTADFHATKRSQRQLNRIKDWEEKCGKEAKRFEKAAEWTEAHFHLEKPKIPDKPPGSDALEDTAVLQAAGSKAP